jgi:hypothetical protein
MNPTSTDLLAISPLLTNISVAYTQAAESFIATRVAPVVPVDLQSAPYLQYDPGDFMRDDARLRPPATESVGGEYRLRLGAAYFCYLYAIHKDIDDQFRANFRAILDADRDATEYVTQQLMVRREKQWADLQFKTGVWTLDQTGVAAAPGANQFIQWNATNSTPINDIAAGAARIRGRTGYKPNTLIVSADVDVQLKSNSQILERYKYTQGGVLTEGELRAVFDVQNYLVGAAYWNTAPEGVAVPQALTMTSIMGKHALLAYVAPRPSLMAPSASYTFAWTGYLGATADGRRIKKFRLEQIASDRIEGEMAYDFKVIAADLGSFFASAVA